MTVFFFSKIRPEELKIRSDVAEIAGTPNKRLFIKIIQDLSNCLGDIDTKILTLSMLLGDSTSHSPFKSQEPQV